jgi:hypothetical protein
MGDEVKAISWVDQKVNSLSGKMVIATPPKQPAGCLSRQQIVQLLPQALANA